MGNTVIDLTNQRFGKWLVLERAENSMDNRAQWKCRCDCGKERIVLGKSLRAGKSTSCGCSRGKRIDLLGEQFGRLKVIAEAPKKANGQTAWVCQCSCGNITTVGTKELRNGDTKSCGCLWEELIVKNEIGNKYGKLTVIARESHINNDNAAYWRCRCDCGNEIVTSGKRLRSGHTMSCGCLLSKGEQLLQNIFTEHQIHFVRQYQFIDCLTENGYPCKFDFALFANDKLLCLIEYDGIQHFEESNWGLIKNQYRDKIKDKYCLSHNIPLIRIPYTDYDKITIDYINERIKEECMLAML